MNKLPLPVRQWGIGPTPLLPSPVIHAFKHLPVPDSIGAQYGPQLKITDLQSEIWNHTDTVDKQTLNALVEFVRQRIHAIKPLKINSRPTIPYPILSLPLSTRSRNIVIKNAKQFETDDVTMGKLLSFEACGVRSAIEIACVLEAAANQPVAAEDALEQAVVMPETSTDVLQAVSPKDALTQTREFRSFRAPPALEPSKKVKVKLKGAPVHPMPTLRKPKAKKAPPITREKPLRLPQAVLISQFISSLTYNYRYILSHRILVTQSPQTLEAIGQTLNLTRERVRQIEEKVMIRMQFLQLDEFTTIVARTKKLRSRIGSALPEDSSELKEQLDWATKDCKEFAAEDYEFTRSLLLWLAGPYKVYQGWLLTNKFLPSIVIDALQEQELDNGLIPKTTVKKVFNRFGVTKVNHKKWLKHLSVFLSVKGGVIYFKGNLLDKSYALLRFYNQPMGVSEILDIIGSGSLRGVTQRLIEDKRFWRINRQNQFVLAQTPGYVEYNGITHAIKRHLAENGGSAPFNYLTTVISRECGVKPTSVGSYIMTPMFTKDENKFVSVRDTSVDFDVPTDINKTAACYVHTDGTWNWRLHVDKDLLRGSGRTIPNALAKKLGCKVGDEIEVVGEFGIFYVRWPLSSNMGANISSLRFILHHLEGEIGDYMFFKTTSPVTFRLLKRKVMDEAPSDFVRLALMLGCTPPLTESEAVSTVAHQFGLAGTDSSEIYSQLREMLNQRSEIKLMNLIPYA